MDQKYEMIQILGVGGTGVPGENLQGGCGIGKPNSHTTTG